MEVKRPHPQPWRHPVPAQGLRRHRRAQLPGLHRGVVRRHETDFGQPMNDSHPVTRLTRELDRADQGFPGSLTVIEGNKDSLVHGAHHSGRGPLSEAPPVRTRSAAGWWRSVRTVRPAGPPPLAWLPRRSGPAPAPNKPARPNRTRCRESIRPYAAAARGRCGRVCFAARSPSRCPRARTKRTSARFFVEPETVEVVETSLWNEIASWSPSFEFR